MTAFSRATGAIMGFMLTWGLPFTLYLVFQTAAVVRLRGMIRYVGMLPIPIMVIVVYVTIEAMLEESNLWPILLIFVSPCFIIFLAILLLVQHKNSPIVPANGNEEERV